MIPSSKKIGKYELQLLEVLSSYFRTKGFQVFPHVQLNISWGNIISDVDLIAKRNYMLVGIEVKSRRDKFKRAFQQLNNIRDFFDKVYIASNKSSEFLERNWTDKRIGLLHIKEDSVIEREGETSMAKPACSTIEMLRRCCLLRLARVLNFNNSGKKRNLAFHIFINLDTEHLRAILKEIVICERTCDTSCPIWEFENRLISPLRSIQKVLEKYSHTGDTPLPLIPAEISDEENNHI